jgi:hypothetical protein
VLAGGFTSARMLESFGSVSAFNDLFLVDDEDEEDAYRRKIWLCVWSNSRRARNTEYF